MAARSNTGILIVEGISLPDPSEMRPSDYDISDSDRNANGKMITQIIREDVHKLECKWSKLEVAEYLLIRRAIKKKFGISVQYFCPDTGEKGTLIMYAGDRKTPILYFKGWEDGKPVYKNVSLNFIEM
jgi:hypothetical protein